MNGRWTMLLHLEWANLVHDYFRQVLPPTCPNHLPSMSLSVFIHLKYKFVIFVFMIRNLTLSKHMQSIDPQTFITLVFIQER